MPNQATFLGASIRGVNSSLGWNSQSSSLSVSLVADSTNSDVFAPPSVGQPVSFQLGSYQFNGLLKKWTKDNDINGLPTYSVECSDIRSILDKVQLIIGIYNGTTGGIPNLFNIYGYYESAGFGQAQLNDSGMPWKLIRNAAVGLASLPTYGLYGGPITYRDYTYTLNLSELPDLPNYFRVFGPTISLMDFIQQICDYGGCDYFIKLSGSEIQVKTASRLNQPPLGTISAIAESLDGQTVIRSSHGIEERDEVTTAFLIGGEVHTLYKSTSLETYWGMDVLYNPIIGYNKRWNFYNSQNRYLGSMIMHMANLNASPVADILGSTFYPCSMLEMRAALMGQSHWINFVERFNPIVANMFSLPGFRIQNNFRGPVITPADRLQANRDAIINLNRIAVSNDQTSSDSRGSYSKTKRLYDFVKHYATNYMGRKYACRVPFVLTSTDIETSQVLFSYEVADAGYIESSGENDLDGLPSAFSDIFQSQDGRYNPFVYYPDTTTADMGSINKGSTLINGYKLYAKCNVDSKIISIPEPAVIVTVDPVYQLPQASNGSYTINEFINDAARAVQTDVNTPPPSLDIITIDGINFPKQISFSLTGLVNNNINNRNCEGLLTYNNGGFWEGSATIEDAISTFFGQTVTLKAYFTDTPNQEDGLFNLLLEVLYPFINAQLFVQIYPEPNSTPTLDPLSYSYFYEPEDQTRGFRVNFNQINSNTNPVRATAGGTGFPELHPPPISISHAHIPLKSNILTYGPWYAGTTPGKVHAEQDGSLVPWNYGGYTGLNNAATARVNSQITNMTVSETGTLELVGLPNFSLGDLMQTGGPNITRINIGYSERGITTTFAFETFVPRYGQMGKYIADRIRRNSLLTQNFLKESKLKYRRGLLATESFGRATAGAIGNYIENRANYLRRQSPHTVFFTRNMLDRNIVRPLISTATLQEALAGCNADDNSLYNQGSIVGIDSLIRPISIYGTGLYISELKMPTGIWLTGLNSYTLNPLKINSNGHDFEIISYNTSGVYTGVHHYRDNIGATEQPRNFTALRGPVLITGHGYDINGSYVPSGNIYTRSDTWKTGPLDPLWDENRKVWTVHDVLKGKTVSEITAASSGSLGYGTINLWMNNQSTDVNLGVYNWFGSSIGSGSKVMANYIVTDNKWFISGADCV